MIHGPLWSPPLKSFALVLALSIAFWRLGAVSVLEVLPGLPVSALGAFSPLTTAAILACRESRDGNFAGVIALLKRFTGVPPPTLRFPVASVRCQNWLTALRPHVWLTRHPALQMMALFHG